MLPIDMKENKRILIWKWELQWKKCVQNAKS